MSIGNKIKNLRKARGMTQESLANGIITRGMLSRIESGSALPSMQSLHSIAKRLEVSPAFLLEEGNDITPAEHERVAKSIEKEYRLKNFSECLNLFSNSNLETTNKFAPLFVSCAFEVAKNMFDKGDFSAAKTLIERINTVLPTVIILPSAISKKRLDFISYLMDNIDNIDIAIDDSDKFLDLDFEPSLFFCLLKLLKNSRHEDCLRLMEFCNINTPYKDYIDAQMMIKDYKFIDAIISMKALMAKNNLPVFLRLLCISSIENCSKLCEDYKTAYENHLAYQKILDSIS